MVAPRGGVQAARAATPGTPAVLYRRVFVVHHYLEPAMAARWMVVMVIVAALTAFASAPAGAASAGELASAVADFCAQHLDQQVGDGQCAALADHALAAAGARVRAGPDDPGPGDYVWGTLILRIVGHDGGPELTGDLGDVRPGDILQYRDTHFITAHFAHHTAVVAGVDPEHHLLTVYQQNIGGRKTVMKAPLRIDNLRAGWIRVYRPQPEP
jgi:hypothetical protein